jgi:hypothetical protein
MSKKENAQKVAKVKTALADKCDRLTKITKSRPRQASPRRQSARFRRQAADLARQ